MYFQANVADTGQDFSLHIVADGYVYGVALVELIDVDRAVVLIVADTLPGGTAVLVDQVTLHGILFLYLFQSLGPLGIDGLIDYQGEPHEGVCTIDSQAKFFLVVALIAYRSYLER